MGRSLSPLTGSNAFRHGSGAEGSQAYLDTRPPTASPGENTIGAVNVANEASDELEIHVPTIQARKPSVRGDTFCGFTSPTLPREEPSQPSQPREGFTNN